VGGMSGSKPRPRLRPATTAATSGSNAAWAPSQSATLRGPVRVSNNMRVPFREAVATSRPAVPRKATASRTELTLPSKYSLPTSASILPPSKPRSTTHAVWSAEAVTAIAAASRAQRTL
jgi:hypothetical protein